MDSLIPFFDPIRGVTMPALGIKILNGALIIA